MSQAKSTLHLFLKVMAKKHGVVADPEHKFHPKRRWKFDYAFPELKLAVEYEGIFSAKSRHTSIVGFTNDCEKYSEAALLGWIVIRVTAKMVQDGRAFDLIRKAFGEDEEEEKRSR